MRRLHTGWKDPSGHSKLRQERKISASRLIPNQRFLSACLFILALAFPVMAGEVSPINSYPSTGEGSVSPKPTLEIECPATPFLSSHWQIARDQFFSLIIYDSGETTTDLCSHFVDQELDEGATYWYRCRLRMRSSQLTSFSAPTFFSVFADSSVVEETVFQKGVFSYANTSDADIRGSFADPTMSLREWNQGAQNVLRAGRRPAGSPTDEIYRTLVQFDVSLLSDPAAVLNAYVEFTGWQHGTPSPVFADRFSLYSLRSSFGEGEGIEGKFPAAGEVSWTYSSFPITWSLPGAGHASDTDPMADRDETLLATIHMTNDVGFRGRWTSRALVDQVKDWIDDPSANHGFLLKADDESYQEVLNLAPKEHEDAYYRPRLVILTTEGAARAPNQAPIARDDIVYAPDPIQVVLDVYDNDIDPDNGPIPFNDNTLTSFTQPVNGLVTRDGTVFTYIPDPGFRGTDTWEYTITDGDIESTATVSVLTTPVQWGGINAAESVPVDVVYVNGGVGVGDERRVVVGQSDPLDIFVDWPPSRFGLCTPYVLYLWIGDSFNPTPLPFDVGISSFPTPLTPAENPQFFRCANNLGYPEHLGYEKWPGPKTQEAAGTILNAPSGIGQAVTFTIQGIMRDRDCLNGVAGMTNGIIVEVQ